MMSSSSLSLLGMLPVPSLLKSSDSPRSSLSLLTLPRFKLCFGMIGRLSCNLFGFDELSFPVESLGSGGTYPTIICPLGSRTVIVLLLNSELEFMVALTVCDCLGSGKYTQIG